MTGVDAGVDGRGRRQVIPVSGLDLIEKRPLFFQRQDGLLSIDPVVQFLAGGQKIRPITGLAISRVAQDQGVHAQNRFAADSRKFENFSTAWQ